MKILCICNHGDVRSPCLARELKILGYEAMAIGIENSWKKYGGFWRGFSDDSIDNFCNWADIIVDLSDVAEAKGRLKSYNDKLLKISIGVDRWHNPFHPDLRRRLKRLIKEEILDKLKETGGKNGIEKRKED